jgi:hypothetical protein
MCSPDDLRVEDCVSQQQGIGFRFRNRETKSLHVARRGGLSGAKCGGVGGARRGDLGGTRRGGSSGTWGCWTSGWDMSTCDEGKVASGLFNVVRNGL